MPPVYRLICNKCGYIIDAGMGGYHYVRNWTGERITCRHPCESEDARQAMGRFTPWFIIRRRMGCFSICICLRCLHRVDLDLNHDEIKCSCCGSTKIVPVYELIDRQCPKCCRGTLEQKVWAMA